MATATRPCPRCRGKGEVRTKARFDLEMCSVCKGAGVISVEVPDKRNKATSCMLLTSDLVPWFQIASTIITGIGVTVSTALGIISLNNYRKDKAKSIRPSLFFNIGGHLLECTLKENRHRNTGISEIDAGKFLEERKYTHKFICTDRPFSVLANHGDGVALDIAVWFHTTEVYKRERAVKLSQEEVRLPPFTRN